MRKVHGVSMNERGIRVIFAGGRVERRDYATQHQKGLLLAEFQAFANSSDTDFQALYVSIQQRSILVPVEEDRTGRTAIALPRGDVRLRPTARRRLPACRSFLHACHALLPPAAREDELAEWLDELETAAEHGEPVVRRTASILVRALPRLAIWHRRPRRASRRG